MKKNRWIITLLALILLLSSCTKAPQTPANTQQTPAESELVQTPAEVQVETPSETDPHISRDGVNYYEKYDITDNGDSITMIDSIDQVVTIPKHPEKVANLYNSHLSLWNLMGGEVMAVAEQADEKPVEGIDHAEMIGKMAEPNIEKLVMLEPDFCIIAPLPSNQETALQLNEMGIPTIYLKTSSKDDYYRLVRIFSAILNDEALFEKFALDIEESIQELLANVPEGKSPTILLMRATQRGVSVLNNQTLNGEMLADLKAINIADNAVSGDRSEEFSMEQIVADDPDVIFVTEMGSNLEGIAQKRKELLEDDPVWSELSAVKNGRYHILPKDLFTYRPNENYLEAYTILAKYLYPDMFTE